MSGEASLIDALFPLTIPLSLLVTHFVGDFILQTDRMALNKSKWNESEEGFYALFYHCLVYALCFLWAGVWFSVVTFLLHFLTDALTSKITSKLWFFRQKFDGENEWFYVAGKRHWFFVAIGADQLTHYLTLGATWAWLL